MPHPLIQGSVYLRVLSAFMRQVDMADTYPLKAARVSIRRIATFPTHFKVKTTPIPQMANSGAKRVENGP